MKIMFCLGSMTKGGAERVIANLSNNFINKYDISIVVTPPDASMYKLNPKINYYTLDKKEQKSNLIIRSFKRIIILRNIIKKDNPDIIVSLLPEPTFRLMIAKLFLRKKVIISVRNDPNVEYNNIFKKILVKILYSKANGFIFQTPDAQKWFDSKIQNKSTIIPNPINSNFICTPYDGIRKKTIVTVGRLVEQKNHKLLIDAFYKFQLKYPEYKLKIYGDGPLRKDILEYINKLKIDTKVLLMGEVDDIKSEIYEDGIFVLSSDFEGMPNALMEAMALGLPCISTNCPCGGPKYLINDGINGYLFEINNTNQLYTLLMKLANDPKKCADISINANKLCDTLNPDIINSKWEEYILKIYNE